MVLKDLLTPPTARLWMKKNIVTIGVTILFVCVLIVLYVTKVVEGFILLSIPSLLIALGIVGWLLKDKISRK